MSGQDLELVITVVVTAHDERQALDACAGLLRRIGGRIVQTRDCSDEEPGCWSLTVFKESGESAEHSVPAALTRAVRRFVRGLGEHFPTPKVACEPPTAWTVLDDVHLLGPLVQGAERVLVEAWAGGDPLRRSPVPAPREERPPAPVPIAPAAAPAPRSAEPVIPAQPDTAPPDAPEQDAEPPRAEPLALPEATPTAEPQTAPEPAEPQASLATPEPVEPTAPQEPLATPGPFAPAESQEPPATHESLAPASAATPLEPSSTPVSPEAPAHPAAPVSPEAQVSPAAPVPPEAPPVPAPSPAPAAPRRPAGPTGSAPTWAGAAAAWPTPVWPAPVWPAPVPTARPERGVVAPPPPGFPPGVEIPAISAVPAAPTGPAGPTGPAEPAALTEPAAPAEPPTTPFPVLPPAPPQPLPEPAPLPTPQDEPAPAPPEPLSDSPVRLILEIRAIADPTSPPEEQARSVARPLVPAGKITRVAPGGRLLAVHVDLGASEAPPTSALLDAAAAMTPDGWSGVERVGISAVVRWSAGPTPTTGVTSLELTATPLSAFQWTEPA